MSKKARSWVMPVGRHQGELITRMPVSYLKWMVCVKHEYVKEAQAELDRRGTVTPDLEVSGHAINRASCRCLRIWQEDRNPGEGLHAWLVRLAREALKTGVRRGPNRYYWQGLLFVFAMDGTWPVLLTVLPKRAPSS